MTLGRNIFLAFIITFFTYNVKSFGQSDNLEVETEIKKISKNKYEVTFEFSIDEGFHLYSQFNAKGASEALKIQATKEGQTDFEIIGKAKESEVEKEFNDTFELEETFFIDEATLVQRIKVKNKKIKELNITITGQICEESCLPYEEEFTIKLPSKKKKKKKNKKKGKNSEAKASGSKKGNNKILLIGGIAAGVLVIGLIAFFATRKKK